MFTRRAGGAESLAPRSRTHFSDHQKKFNLVLAALLACVLAALLAPGMAAAAQVTFTVDSTANEADSAPGSDGCKTAASKCTLRAAIEESNASVGDADKIVFDASFNGQLADTIALGASLPTIADAVTIDGEANGAALGGQCATQGGDDGPCVGISGPAGGAALVLEAPGSVVEGLSVTGAGIGIEDKATATVAENWLGTALDGKVAANEVGVKVSAGAMPQVISNEILGGGNAGVLLDNGGGVVAENLIVGKTNGVRAINGEVGASIEKNVIEDSTGAGVLIESDLNIVIGNQVVGSGAAGIRVHSPGAVVGATRNVIGDSFLLPGQSADENVISDSAGPAIELNTVEKFTGEAMANQVLRNRGSGNNGPFIDLVAVNPGTELKGPNKGMKPPVILTATKTGVSGTGEPEAKVRVFRKATASPGELESFLEFAVVEADGTWEIEYQTPIAGGTVIAATQTIEEEVGEAFRTSELAIETTDFDPPTVTSLTPNHGTTPGGSSVVIAGTQLNGASKVEFGGTTIPCPSASCSIDGPTQLTVKAPAHAVGQVDVLVTNPAGTSLTGASAKYTYEVPLQPTVTGLSPTHGAAAGGNLVTITGTELWGASAVKFGAGSATDVNVVNGTTITAKAPAGSGGTTVDVTVTTPGGTSPTTGTGNDYGYDAPPAPTCATDPSLCPPQQQPAAVVTVPAPPPLATPKPKPKPVTCKKGFQKKKVGGKTKCVKVKKGKKGRR